MQNYAYVRYLNPDQNLVSVASIDDLQFHWPERICIDSLLDTERMGATIINYTEACGIIRKGDFWVVSLRCPDCEVREVTGKNMLNYAGACIDDINSKILTNRSPARQIAAVKGASIAVKLPEHLEGIGIAGINSHGEAIMCVPLGKLHYITLVLRKQYFKGGLDDVRPEATDIDELLFEIRKLLPHLQMDRSKKILCLGRCTADHL